MICDLLGIRCEPRIVLPLRNQLSQPCPLARECFLELALSKCMALFLDRVVGALDALATPGDVLPRPRELRFHVSVRAIIAGPQGLPIHASILLV